MRKRAPAFGTCEPAPEHPDEPLVAPPRELAAQRPLLAGALLPERAEGRARGLPLAARALAGEPLEPLNPHVRVVQIAETLLERHERLEHPLRRPREAGVHELGEVPELLG